MTSVKEKKWRVKKRSCLPDRWNGVGGWCPDRRGRPVRWRTPCLRLRSAGCRPLCRDGRRKMTLFGSPCRVKQRAPSRTYNRDGENIVRNTRKEEWGDTVAAVVAVRGQRRQRRRCAREPRAPKNDAGRLNRFPSPPLKPPPPPPPPQPSPPPPPPSSSHGPLPLLERRFRRFHIIPRVQANTRRGLVFFFFLRFFKTKPNQIRVRSLRENASR